MFVSKRANLQDRIKREGRKIGMSLLGRALAFFVDQNRVRFNTGALDNRPSADFAGNLFDHIAASPVHDNVFI